LREVIPLRERKLDYIFIVFFALNLFFITYIVDIEQNIIADPYNFTYPIWPPRPFVDMIHSYGNTIDPLLMARPVWWRTTIWIDTLFFGPFYAAGLYALLKGKDWIRLPSIIWAAMLITNVLIILSEEISGPHAAPNVLVVLALNLPWLLVPAFMIYRMWKDEHPFTRVKLEAARH
jgi:emopamil binding protein